MHKYTFFNLGELGELGELFLHNFFYMCLYRGVYTIFLTPFHPNALNPLYINGLTWVSYFLIFCEILGLYFFIGT